MEIKFHFESNDIKNNFKNNFSLVFYWKTVPKNFVNSMENYSDGAPILVNFRKKRLHRRFCDIFQNSFFKKHLRATCFVKEY